MDEENINNSKIEIKKKIHRKYNVSIKKPLTPYFLFCQEKREEYQKVSDQKLDVKTLGELWRKLPEEKKKPYKEKYEIAKAEYDQKIEKLKSMIPKIKKDKNKKAKNNDDEKEEEEEENDNASDDDEADIIENDEYSNESTTINKKKNKTRKAKKAKAKTNKLQHEKDNLKACNCGECDECKKTKKKNRNQKD